MPIHWSESLSVGNSRIDSDHKHLISIINMVERAVQSKDFNLLSNQLAKLSHYADIHFRSEELIALSAKYPDCEHMHISHVALSEILGQCRRKIDDTGMTSKIADDIIKLLRSWLLDHVIKEDLKMKPYLMKYTPELGQ